MSMNLYTDMTYVPLGTTTVYTQDGCMYVRAFHIDEGHASLCTSKGSGSFDTVEGCINLACEKYEEESVNAFNYRSVINPVLLNTVILIKGTRRFKQ